MASARTLALLVLARTQQQAWVGPIQRPIAVVVQPVTDLRTVIGPIVRSSAILPPSGHAQVGPVNRTRTHPLDLFTGRQHQIGVSRVRIPITVVVRPVADLLLGYHCIATLPAQSALAVFGACASSPTVRNLAGTRAQGVINPTGTVVVQPIAYLGWAVIRIVVRIISTLARQPGSGQAQARPVHRTRTLTRLNLAKGNHQTRIARIAQSVTVVIQAVTGLGPIVGGVGAVFGRTATLPSAGAALGQVVHSPGANALLAFAGRRHQAPVGRIGEAVTVVVQPVTALGPIAGAIIQQIAVQPAAGHAQSGPMGGPSAHPLCLFAGRHQQIGVGRIGISVTVVVETVADLPGRCRSVTTLPPKSALADLGARTCAPAIAEFTGTRAQGVIDPIGTIVVQPVANLGWAEIGTVALVVGVLARAPHPGHTQAGPVLRSGAFTLLLLTGCEFQADITAICHSVAVVVQCVTQL